MSKEVLAYYMTWTTYGNWMPGDGRGWRRKLANRKSNRQPPRYDDGRCAPQPLLASWCREQMKGSEVKLTVTDRLTVENAIREHCEFRGWHILAVNARSNHVHLVVHAFEKPNTVRDQIKANCTRHLRQQSVPLHAEKTWTTGGDIEFIDDEVELERVTAYVIEYQD